MGEFAYCLNTSTIKPTPLLEKIRIASAVGFEAIEPWNDEIDSYLQSGGTLEILRKTIGDAGLKVVSMICLFGWTDANPEVHSKAIEMAKRRMDQALKLGSPYIVASPPNEMIDLGFAAQRYAELLQIGREIGVKPSMEFLGFVEGIHTLEAAKTIADGADDPDSTIVADVFHLIRGGGSIDDLLSIRGHEMANFHINDLPSFPEVLAQTDGDRVMLGEGIADLPKVIANLRQIGYRGPISLELFNEKLWTADPIEVCRNGLRLMKELIEG